MRFQKRGFLVLWCHPPCTRFSFPWGRDVHFPSYFRVKRMGETGSQKEPTCPHLTRAACWTLKTANSVRRAVTVPSSRGHGGSPLFRVHLCGRIDEAAYRERFLRGSWACPKQYHYLVLDLFWIMSTRRALLNRF